jgi:hypothetical protein
LGGVEVMFGISYGLFDVENTTFTNVKSVNNNHLGGVIHVNVISGTSNVGIIFFFFFYFFLLFFN